MVTWADLAEDADRTSGLPIMRPEPIQRPAPRTKVDDRAAAMDLLPGVEVVLVTGTLSPVPGCPTQLVRPLGKG